MARLIKQDRGNYTNTSNLVVRDDRLHWNSRGVFNYLWSQANEWQFYVKEIAQHSPGGETELRTCLNELEEYGYLKRTPRHREGGQFGGMDWILSDTGGLNRHQENTDDGANAQNPPKKGDQPSSGSPVGRFDRRTDNRTLRNNNNKKYQHKEISTVRNKDKGVAENATPAPTIPYKEIVDYLNLKAGTHYKSSTKPTQRLIRARWREGYTLDDFKKVVDNKAFEWQQDSKMWKYMRPATLFGSKFDDYLNANDLNKHQAQPVSGGYDTANASDISDISDDDLPF